jgi:hypothetical protein
MALLASPDVGVRRRPLLRTVRLAFAPIFARVPLVAPTCHDIASASAEALVRRRINLAHGHRMQPERVWPRR